LCYLVFQLFSHKNLYDDHHSDVQQSVAYPSNVAKRLHARTSIEIERKIPPASSSPPPTDGVIDPAQRDARTLEACLEEEEVEKPEMGMQTTIILLVVVTVVC
jgi:Ca2+:H+ antiporter